MAAIEARLRAEADAAPPARPPTDEAQEVEWGDAALGWYVESLSMKDGLLFLGVERPTSPKEVLKVALLRLRATGLPVKVMALRPRSRAPRGRRSHLRRRARSPGRLADDGDPEPDRLNESGFGEGAEV